MNDLDNDAPLFPEPEPGELRERDLPEPTAEPQHQHADHSRWDWHHGCDGHTEPVRQERDWQGHPMSGILADHPKGYTRYGCNKCTFEIVRKGESSSAADEFVQRARKAGFPERHLGLLTNAPPHPHWARLANPRDVLVIHGGAPTARAEAACLAAAVAIRASKRVHVFRAAESDQWYSNRKGQPRGMGTTSALLEGLPLQLVVILDMDDFATGHDGAFRSPLVEALRCRYDKRLPTVVTTSLSPEQWTQALGGTSGPGPEWWANGIDVGGRT